MEYPITISKDKYYKAALSVINCFLNLTELELEVIVCMLNNNIKLLNTLSRKELRGLLDVDVYTFNNYIKRLKDKKTLIETTYGLAIHPSIVNSLSDKEIRVKFTLN